MEGLARVMEGVRASEDAAGVEYRLLLMHTGVEGIVPRIQGLPSMAQFQPLRKCVDYLALGHVHKPYEFDGWMYNPGSTETWGAEEAAWERSYYFVEIDTNAAGESDEWQDRQRHRAVHLVNKLRPFVRYELRVDGLGEPNTLYDRMEDHFRTLEHTIVETHHRP